LKKDMKMVSIWGLVLARKGSKRLPNKALLPLAGKPLAAHTFTAASQSSSLNALGNSCWMFSDEPKLLEMAKAYELNIPDFERPAALSGDESSTFDTVRYFLQQWPAEAWPEVLVLLQVTSPLRTAADIDEAIAQFLREEAEGCEYLVSVHRPLKPPHWTYSLLPNGRLEPALAKSREYVFPNGALYIFRPELLMSGRLEAGLQRETSKALNMKAFMMPWERSLDVDYALDMKLAEWLLEQQALTAKTRWQGKGGEQAVRTKREMPSI
jgi:CMP-N,N'-diacetyllegionaminic acid synthase